MTQAWPRAWGECPGSARIRCSPEDFQVSEQLGFELSGEGEHAFLHLQKRQLNSMELLEQLAVLSGVAQRDIGMSGLKDRNAVTRQWFSVGLGGRGEPDWQTLEESGKVRVLQVGRHQRKLRRGVHKANRFSLLLRDLQGDPAQLDQRLQLVRDEGVPNYFGEQRFGRNASTLQQARRWISSGRRITRNKRSLYFSALRAYLFNEVLAARVRDGNWNKVLPGDICMLRGSRSLFACDQVDEDIKRRAATGDIQPGLPLWGRGAELARWQTVGLGGHEEVCQFLEQAGLELAWRPARLLADDFCWQFCDDGSLRLDFSLSAGSYATALLAELVQYKEGQQQIGNSSE